MRLRNIAIVTALLALTAAAGMAADNSGRIYGRVTLYDGDVLEGLIRWDKNEANWVDILNGTKEVPRQYLRDERYRDRREYAGKKEIEFFGIKIGETSGSSWSGNSACGIRFGHIRELEVIDDDRALLTLKSGQELELEESSTDLGSAIRGIVIEDADEGEIELIWEDIERIEFMAARSDEASRFGERLYGTLTTRRGEEFTGFVCWDIDELFEEDILDGDERNRSRKIPFEKIDAIERYSSSAARVFLKNGEDMVLRGSNDVDDDNRGIVISDPSFGDVMVEWSEFERLEFSRPERQVTYDDFDGGRPLYGTVYTEDDDSYTGEIRWDNDEAYTWEIIDGTFRNVEFDIEFSHIKEIRRRGYSGAIVTLRDGREFQLRDSNDIDDSNKGIYITTEGGEDIVVYWDEFDRAEFPSR
ncbi:hypothetical protein GF420_01455 [candidate division GN15 bacterium]|nr:hypothetical protein [candidate division GN15 bacterium]